MPPTISLEMSSEPLTELAVRRLTARSWPSFMITDGGSLLEDAEMVEVGWLDHHDAGQREVQRSFEGFNGLQSSIVVGRQGACIAAVVVVKTERHDDRAAAVQGDRTQRMRASNNTSERYFALAPCLRTELVQEKRVPQGQ